MMRSHGSVMAAGTLLPYLAAAGMLIPPQAEAASFILRPNGDRAGSCGLSCSIDTCHYCLIDETPALDEDYVFAGSPAYARDTYDLTDHSTETGAITGVEFLYRAKTTGKSGYLKGVLIVPGDHRYFGAEKKLSHAWALYSDAWTTNPYTGKPWQWGEIDALQVGLDLRSLDDPAGSGTSQCSQAYVVVTYDPSTPAAR
jgi:hypothetical protein